MEVVGNLVAEHPRPTLILGAPGIGKTNLTLAALHDSAVAARYGERRYFIRCEGASTPAAVISELARVMTVPLVGGDLLTVCLAELSSAPSVVCLDNAETPWEAAALPCEELFEQLAAASSLLVSLRGAERTGGPAWAKPIRLDPLGIADARTLFLSIASDRFVRSDLSQLLEEMGGIPLAIELLASAAEGEASLDDLGGRWREERVSLLERGSGDHRLLSVAVSVEVSWHGRLMTEPARRLLALLGRLTDGVAHIDLEAVLPHEGRRAASVLRRRGLAFDEAGRLRTHPPLRHHVSAAHPPAVADWSLVIAYYSQLADQLGRKVGETGGAEAGRRLTAETANLTATLLAGLGEDDAGPALAGISGAARFASFTGADLAQLADSSLQLIRTLPVDGRVAGALKGLGDIALARSEHEEARARYEEALPMYRQVRDILGEANCITSLADMALERSDHEGARTRYEEALPLYRQVGDVLGEADCIEGLGDIALRRSDHERAMTRYQEALPLYRKMGSLRGEATCIEGLADVALERSDLQGALALYQEALPMYRQVGDTLGEANCIASLADIALERLDHENARSRYEEALPKYRQVGFLRGEASCIKSLGDIALGRSDHERAKERYEEALPMYRQVGSVLGEANCIKGLGDVALERSDHASAGLRYEEALTLYQRMRWVRGQANCIVSLGDMALTHSDHDGARARYEEALLLYQCIPEQYSIGQTYRRLARLAPNEQERRERVEAARKAWIAIERLDLLAQLDTEFPN
jgi:tetratricopeptide (TPR) repeat protein